MAEYQFNLINEAQLTEIEKGFEVAKEVLERKKELALASCIDELRATKQMPLSARVQFGAIEGKLTILEGILKELREDLTNNPHTTISISDCSDMQNNRAGFTDKRPDGVEGGHGIY